MAKPGFLSTRQAAILSAVLILQAGLFYGASHGEPAVQEKPLSLLPTHFGSWSLVQEGVVDEETEKVLRADDTVTRQYTDASQNFIADLFVAYFRSQRQGQTPHSPQHCMPGAGWVPVSNSIIPVSLPGHAEPIQVNRYVLSKGFSKDVVLYWYQSRRRVVASEYKAKMYLVADALRYNRTDTALVRVIVPVADNGSEQAATDAGIDFIRSFFDTLSGFLPS